MSEQEDINRGFLRDKLGNYAVDPPEKVWEAISGQIDRGRKRRGMYILLVATAASIALAISLGIHFLGPDLPAEQSALDDKGPQELVAETDPGLPEAEEAKEILALQEDPMEQESGPEPSTADPVQVQPGKEIGKPEVIREIVEQVVSGEPEAAGEPREDGDPGQAPDPPEFEDLSGIETARNLEPDLQLDSALELNTDPFPVLEPEKKRNTRWMLGAAISPLYSYRDADAAALPPDQAESGLLSYSTGVNIRYRRNSRFAIETGIYYNRTGIAIGAPGIRVFSQSYDNMIFGVGSESADINDVSNSVGNIVAYSGDIYMNGYKINAENGGDALQSQVFEDVQVAESGIRQHLDYLELPFNLRYSVIDRTFELQLVGGFSTNFLVGNSVTMEGSSGREEIGYLSNLNTVNYSGNAGLGMFYHMGRKTSLFLEPRFRYFLNSVNDASLPVTRPYSIGFYTGLSYTF